MLSPKKVKFRKQFKGKNRGTAGRGSSIEFGDYALKAVENSKMSAQQIEAARIAINRKDVVTFRFVFRKHADVMRACC